MTIFELDFIKFVASEKNTAGSLFCLLLVLEKALALAEESNDRILTRRCGQACGLACRQQRNWDRARLHYLDANQAAEALGSRPLSIMTVSSLMAIEMQAGRPPTAAKYRMQLARYSDRQQIPPLVKNAWDRAAVWIYCELADAKMASIYRELILQPAAVGAIHMLEAASQSKDTQYSVLAEAKRKSEQRADAERRQHEIEQQQRRKSSAVAAASLSRQMLAYAGKQQIAKKRTDLNELVANYESVLRSSYLPAQQLNLNLSADSVISKVDLTQVEQVVLKLVANAVQASANQGLITITTGFETIDSVVDNRSFYGTRSSGGEFCFIEVVDSGKGISEADLERVFEPFYSRSELGRGLDLDLIRQPASAPFRAPTVVFIDGQLRKLFFLKP